MAVALEVLLTLLRYCNQFPDIPICQIVGFNLNICDQRMSGLCCSYCIAGTFVQCRFFRHRYPWANPIQGFEWNLEYLEELRLEMRRLELLEV